MAKRLYRRRTDRVLWGVCGGLADYFDMDPVLIRIIFFLLIFANGLGIIAYLVMAILVPLEGSERSAPKDAIRENFRDMKQSASKLGDEIRGGVLRSTAPGPSPQPPTPEGERRGRQILGIVIVVVGIFLLITTLNLFAWFRWAFLWPLILVAVGLLIIVASNRK